MSGNITTEVLLTAKEKLDKSLEKVEEIKTQRKFKPGLLTYIWTQNTKDGNGLRTVSIDTNVIDESLNSIAKAGADGVEICEHIGYNTNTRQLFYMTNLETIDYVISKAHQLGLKTPLIKLHQKFNVDQVKYLFANTGTKEDNLYNTEVQTDSIAEFKNQYTNMVKEICTRYKNSNVTYITCFNEWQHFWDREIFPHTQNSSETDTTQVDNPMYVANFPSYVVDTIKLVQGYGYKSGVSTAGFKDVNSNDSSIWSSFNSVDSSIIEAEDCIFANLYPPVGSKGTSTTLEDCIKAWENNLVHEYISKIKTDYEGKELFITETGTMDMFDALYSPGYPAWDSATQNGEVQTMYINAMLEVMKQYSDTEVNYITWWYTNLFTTNSDKVKEVCENYLGK